MPADREGARDGAERAAHGQSQGHPPARHPRDLEEEGVDAPIRSVREGPGQQPAQQPRHRSLEEEGSADEAVLRPHEPHDVDLLAAGEDGDAQGRPDDQGGDDRERRAEHQGRPGADAAQVEEPVHPLAAVARILHERIRHRGLGDLLHDFGVARARAQGDLERLG